MPLHLFFFYATIILLPTQLGFHFWPDWAMVLGRRLDYLSPTIFLTDITILLTLLTWFISSFPSLKIKNYLKFVACVGFVGLNIFFASSPLVALYKWTKVLEFAIFGFYIIKTKPSFSRSLWCLSFAALYSSIIAITQFIFQHSIGGPLWFLGERTFDISTPGIARIQLLPTSLFPYLPIHLSSVSELLRPYATFPHPNVLGGFLAVTLPLLIFNNVTMKQLDNWQVSLIKLFRVSTIILGTLALILTFSRSAWVAGVIGLIVVLFIRFNSTKNHLFVGFVVFMAFVGLFLMLPYFQTLTANNESVFVRNELNAAAVQMVIPTSYPPAVALAKEGLPISPSPHLFFGVGLGNFLVELPTYYPHRDIFFLQPVHNIYLLLLSETGIIGMGITFYCLYLLFKHRERKGPFVICRLSLVILLLLGAVDHYPLTLQQGQLFLTILLSFSFL